MFWRSADSLAEIDGEPPEPDDEETGRQTRFFKAKDDRGEKKMNKENRQIRNSFFFIIKYDNLNMVKNKIVVVVGVAIVASLVFWGVMWSVTKAKKSTDQTATQNQPIAQESGPTPTSIPAKSTWKDEAGFVFTYPVGVTVTQKVDDPNRYTNLTIESQKEKGQIIILAEDTRYSNVEAWVKNDTNLKGGNVIETSLGDKPSKKIMFSDNGKLIAGAIDDQILFLVKTDMAKSDYWMKLFNEIFDSWEFFYPTPVAAKPAAKPVVQTETEGGSGILEEIE
jgi:hypothetical protein